MERESFVFYKSFYEALICLDEKDQLACFDAMARYALYGEAPEVTGAAKSLFIAFKPQIDANNRRYSNGCKGGKPKANQTVTKDIPKSNQTVTKVKPNVNVNDNENDNENVNDNANVKDNESPTETKERVKREKTSLTQDQMHNMIQESALSCQTQDKVREWIQYKQARREPYKEMGFKSLISQVYKHEREAGVEAVCDLIDLCMSNEWKGIIWDKLPREIPQRAAPGGKIDWANI